MSDSLVPLQPEKKTNVIKNWLIQSSPPFDSSRKQHEKPKRKQKNSNASRIQYIDLHYSDQNPNEAVQVGLSLNHRSYTHK